MLGKLCVFIVAALVLGSTSLTAQTTTGSLRGAVTDESGAVLPGATVELTSDAQIGGAKTAVADSNGQYRFLALTPGVYTLKASLEGFKTIIREGLRVEVGRTFDVDMRLEVGTLAETITVTSEAPLVDTSQSAVTVNYNQELIKDTPVLRFSVFDYFQMTPGISSTQVQDSTTSSAFGSNTNENQYQIDGTNITSPTAGQMWPYPNTDIVAEMELVGVGAPAEYGNMQGAVFNIVTKSGGNNLRGLINWFSQYQAATDNNQPDAEFPYHRDRFQDATMQLGGPLVRDKMWWFGSYQYRRDYYAELGTDPEFLTLDSQDRVFGKMTWAVNQSNNLLFAYHNDHWRLPDTITPSVPNEAASLGAGHNPTVTATWRRVLNDTTTFDLRYGGFYNWSSTIGNTNDLVTPAVYDEITEQYSANYQGATTGYSWSNLAPYTTGISGRISRFLTLGGQQHDVRLGVQFTDGGTQTESVWPGGRQITLRDGAPAYIDVRDPSISGGHVRAFGVYADDSWAVTGRLTVNAGVRFDLNSGDIPEMPILDAARNEVGTAEAVKDLVDWKTFSPRLGLNMKLRESGTVMRASYGRYYQGSTTNLFSALSPAQAITRRLGWNAATQQFDILQQITDPRGTYVIDPDLKAPYTDQYTIGVDHELIRSLAVGASYIHKRAEDFVGRVDVGSTFATETRNDPQTGAPITVFRRTSPAADRLVMLTNPGPDTCSYCSEDWHQRYNAFLLTLTKRMSNHWQAVGSITVSKTEGLHSASSLTTSSAQSSAASTFGDDPNELTNAFGLLPGDRNVMFKLQGSYVFPHEFIVSSNWQWVAGRPFTRRFSVGGLPQGTQTVFLEPRDGSLRMPSQNFVDMRFEKRFAFGGTSRITLMADIINVLNIDTPLSWISEVITSSNFAVQNVIANPRRAMFALRYEF